MMNSPTSRAAFPSDLTEDQWRQIRPLLPDEKPKGRHRVTDLRDVVNAIRYREQSGCSWRSLPTEFPAWGTVYSYFRRWNRDGTLADLREILTPQMPQPPLALPKSSAQPKEQSA